MSDYFRAMLTGSMIEARQDHVDLKGVTSHAVKILLNFAYTGKCVEIIFVGWSVGTERNCFESNEVMPLSIAGELVLNVDECMEILAGACHLQMRRAIELCSNFLESELCAKTCVDILNIGETFALSKVSRPSLPGLLV